MIHWNDNRVRPPGLSPRPGFTLVEVLIVIGIIAILLGILIPVVSGARRAANTVKCLDNQKQLVTACLLYARDHNEIIPYSGFNNGSLQPKQWAYDLSTGPMNGTQKEVEGGQLWPYLNNYGSYHCPQTSGPYPSGSIQYLTNYVMNGAMSAFNPPKYLDIKQFKSDDVVFWEVPTRGISNLSNDATNVPQEGVASRHKHGTTLSHIDGHVDVVSAQEFVNMFQTGPSPLWADPTRTDGGFSLYFGGAKGPPPTSIPVQEE